MRTIPQELIRLIPARYVEQHRVVPLRRQADRLVLAHPAQLDPRRLQEVAVLLNEEIEPVVVDDAELDQLIRDNYGVGAQAIQTLLGEMKLAPDNGERRVLPDIGRVATEHMGESADEPAIVSFVNDLFVQAQQEGATDVHIEPFENTLRVRFRIDGVLHEIPVPSEVHHFHSAIVSRIKVMSHLDIAEHRLPQDGRIKGRSTGGDFDFRVSILPTQHGETVDIRILANESILRGLESLGFLKEELHVVHDILARPHGVVLVTGPTGSGKTTTLYSFLNVLNQTERKILTIEDPIEYHLEGISQVQVHPRIGLTFAQGLRSMLRHDPDVMMVGEIRDQETAETVIRVALTGHLVFSTVHTNDAPSTPVRLLEMGIEPYLVASSVECILAQRLVRLVCEDCREPERHELTVDALGVSAANLDRVLGDGPREFSRGRGCAACRQTGYRGRIAIFEILPMTSEVQDRVLARASAKDLRMLALAGGFPPLRWRGLRLAAAGKTTVEEILRVTASHVES